MKYAITGLLLGSLTALPGLAQGVHGVMPGSAGLPSPGTTSAGSAVPFDVLEVRVRQPVSLQELSSELSVESERLASLNAVPPTHRFKPGDWLRIPTSSSFLIERVSSLDPLKVRDGSRMAVTRRAALASPTAPGNEVSQSQPAGLTAVVKLGDTLGKIAQRYGISLSQLISLNPDLKTAQLVVGSHVRLTYAPPPVRTQPLIGVKPTGSGGVSWPDTPSYSGVPFNPSSAGGIAPLLAPNAPTVTPRTSGNSDRDELFQMGAMAPFELTALPLVPSVSIRPLRFSPDLSKACRQLAISPGQCTRAAVSSTYDQSPSARELALLERMRSGEPYSYQPAWRRFGLCKYDWKGWRLHSHGVRTTLVSCDDQSEQWAVGVSCQRLMVATRQQDGQWGAWNRPAGPDSQTLRGQDEMVAALCANAIGR